MKRERETKWWRERVRKSERQSGSEGERETKW
jgi:hypothetical protein